MIEIPKVDCHGCHACDNVCPVNAIKMQNDNEGFWYPEVNYDVCIKCKLCIKVCPSLSETKETTTRKAYAAYNNDEKIRLESSSGGVFTLLAQEVINKSGAVFGVVFNDENKVVHTKVEDMEGVAKMRGSKYVQSKIGNTFKECKELLDSGRDVMFTGTPCQIGGLKSYLRKDYDNLITLDIICHGVPSPKVWDIYKHTLSKNKVEKIKFRDKRESWENFGFSYDNNERTTYENKDKNPYMKAFLKDIDLRPSCYSCNYKTLDRSADITIADFWGINNVLPEMNDQKGTSFIITHNSKGESALAVIENHITIKSVEVNDGVQYNSAAIKSVAKPKARANFIAEVNESNFNELVNKYTKVKLSRRILSKVKSMIYYKIVVKIKNRK